VEIEPPGKGPTGRPRTKARVVEGTAPRLEARVLAERLPPRAWRRYRIKEGAKGESEAEFAFVRVTRSKKRGEPAAGATVVFRRSLEEGTVKIFLTNAPRRVTKKKLARVSGMRWPIETAFEEAKGEVGMDHYEVRTWRGWHHHMTQTFLAHAFLVRMRRRGKKSGLDAAASEAAGDGGAEGTRTDHRASTRDRGVSPSAKLRGVPIPSGSHRSTAPKAPKAPKAA
jgi:hypothetical protein